MAEGGLRQGRALRVYQIALILALGWLAGRLPGLLTDNQHEKQSLSTALGLADASKATAARAAPRADAQAEARMAADIAARVAADVAERTVARLIEAGWGPPGQTGILPTRAAASPPETIIRLVTDGGPAVRRDAVWSLPPTAAPAAPAPAASSAGQANAAPAGPVAQPPAADSAGARAHAIATAGYDALRAGDRRRAVALLDEAVQAAPDSAAARQWHADRQLLMKRWSLAGYVLSRSGSIEDPLAASPVLGGAQAGAAVGYMLNPLANSRVSVIGRLTAAMGTRGSIDRETAEAAVGVRLQPSRHVPVAIDIERRIALGYFARDAWAARLSGGGDTGFRAAGRAWRLRGYGEAGIVGLSDPALYAGGQADATTPIVQMGRVSVDGGGGIWGATQRNYGLTVSRLDVGPSAQFRVHPWPFRAQVDYRAHVAGNARPGSGVVLTVAGEF